MTDTGQGRRPDNDTFDAAGARRRLKAAVRSRLRRWLRWLMVPVAAAFAAAWTLSDVRWAVVGLMLVLVVIPMVLLPVCLNELLKQPPRR